MGPDDSPHVAERKRICGASRHQRRFPPPCPVVHPMPPERDLKSRGWRAGEQPVPRLRRLKPLVINQKCGHVTDSLRDPALYSVHSGGHELAPPATIDDPETLQPDERGSPRPRLPEAGVSGPAVSDRAPESRIPRWVTPERVDHAVAGLCLLFVLETAFFAPLNQDAAFALRQASAQSEGALPCRDIYCEYTPLATTAFALVGGAVVPSLLLAQLANFVCALLTRRLALILGFTSVGARRVFVAAWALLIANEGRGIEFEPMAVACLLCAANILAASRGRAPAFRAGLWIAAGFWTKQYALLGWPGLAAASLWAGKVRAAVAMTAGVVVGAVAPAIALLVLGAEGQSLASLLDAGAYPARPLWRNLVNSPELLGALVLAISTLTRADLGRSARPDVRVPALMTMAAMLPFYFRGYRHYWQIVIPFLVLLALRPVHGVGTTATRVARRGAAFLLMLSVGLDVGRCVRDIATGAREQQRVAATRMASFANGATRPLYLVDPALLAWMNAPILASKEVGPKYTRFSTPEAEALVAAADLVVWDTSVAGADELLRHFSGDAGSALRSRGFALSRTVGTVRIYSPVP